MPQLEEIEDIDDIDNMDMDLAEFDPYLTTPIAPAKPKPTIVRSEGSEPSNTGLNQDPNTAIDRKNVVSHNSLSEQQLKELKSMQLIYPCYFDINRSEKQGRRMKKKNCVRNPLAKTILDACRQFNLAAILEPEKTHPQDFGNSGRVRVGLKYEGEVQHPTLKSKRDLMLKISDYLKQHQTSLQTVKELPGPPELMDGNYTPLEVSRVKGFKMNTIVPLHSPLTMKNPQTASAYFKNPSTPQGSSGTSTPTNKLPKTKIQRIRA
ncbi:hypothetical protein CANARDRAFT_195428 [[Candida] arabinofermentans NRRL YB-2248]|uniref:Signal recognition particle SEC65 subunit n=1 Tax=[Candida] arabinofermentans NRRL YB-2248 TaxID=983967 RepID=A0A1E4T5E1_9ASCO|nr:hypothetical protein CANARDRAFT_195428 [[Candida] arabinofermentans NRRL YB-2248]